LFGRYSSSNLTLFISCLLLNNSQILNFILFEIDSHSKGPFDVGSAVIVKYNLINLMLDLADSDDLIQEVTCFIVYTK
jgi:hypothetical protein